MACEECESRRINRRDFLSKSAVAAAALIAAEACGDGQIGPPLRTVTASGDPNAPVGPAVTVALSDFPGLAITGTVVDIGHERALVRTGPSSFVGLSRICTHEQCDADVKNNRIECPCHNSIFAADGSVIQGPATIPLSKLTCVFDQTTGKITVA